MKTRVFFVCLILCLQSTVRSVAQEPIKAVGNLEGSLNVSNGVAIYTIPIAVPKGIGAAQPTISLQYNSMSHSMGMAGWGWNVSAAGCISRGHQTYDLNGVTRPMNTTGHQNFYLDGELLLPTEGDVSTATEYVTQSESYSKINQIGTAGNPKSWLVTQKDGTTYEYGLEENQRIDANGIVTWMLSKMTDPLGNTIHYTYKKWEDNEIVLSTITYADKIIQFIYRYRNSPNIGFVNHTAIRSSKILDKIITVSKGESSLEYQLAYRELSGKSYLGRVTLKGTKGRNYQHLSTSFDYGDLYNFETLEATQGHLARDYGVSILMAGDFNGDGRADILRTSETIKESNNFSTDAYEILSYPSQDDFSNSSESLISKHAPARTLAVGEGFLNVPIDLLGKGQDGLFRAVVSIHKYKDLRGQELEDGALRVRELYFDSFTADNKKLKQSYESLGVPNNFGRSFTYAAPGIMPFIQGDFDGDGRPDIIGILAYQELKSNINQEVIWFWWETHRKVVNSTPIYRYVKKAFFYNLGTGHRGAEILGLSDNDFSDAKSVLPIDVDGDGKQELMIIYHSGHYKVYAIDPISAASGYSFKAKIYFESVSPSEQGGFKPESYDYLTVGDFNGDRNVDLLGVKIGSTEVRIGYSNGKGFEYGLVNLKKPYSADDLLMAVDLNGDGISDIYHKNARSYKANSRRIIPAKPGGRPEREEGWDSWRVDNDENVLYVTGASRKLSTEKRYYETKVCEFQLPSFKQQHPDAVVVSSKVGCFDPMAIGLGRESVEYTVRYNFSEQKTIYPTYNSRSLSHSSVTDYALPDLKRMKNVQVADFNGDGVLDIHNPMDGKVITISGKSTALKGIIDNNGLKTQIAYQSLNTKTNAIYTQETINRSHPNPSMAPLSDIRIVSLSIPVVKSVIGSDGLGGNIVQSYRYKDAVWDRGKGLLGFKETSQTSSLGTKVVSIFALNDAYHTLYPSKTETYLNNVLQSVQKQDFIFKPLSVGNSIGYYKIQRFKMQLQSAFSRNVLNNAASKESFEYDAQDNVVKKIIQQGYGDGVAFKSLSTEISTIQYGKYGKARFPIAPTEVFITRSRGNLSAPPVKTTYTYNAQGLVHTKTDGVGTPLLSSITYTYTPKGNILNTIEKNPNRADIITSFTYDVAGILPVKSIRKQGNIYTEIATKYDPIWLKPIDGTVGVAGQPGALNTTYVYDALGKLVSTTNPMKHTVTEVWSHGTQGTYAYVHSVDAPEGVAPDVREYYDILGRLIRKETLGWDGKWSTTTTTYNAKGQKVKESLPFNSASQYKPASSTSSIHSTDSFTEDWDEEDGLVPTWYYYLVPDGSFYFPSKPTIMGDRGRKLVPKPNIDDMQPTMEIKKSRYPPKIISKWYPQAIPYLYKGSRFVPELQPLDSPQPVRLVEQPATLVSPTVVMPTLAAESDEWGILYTPKLQPLDSPQPVRLVEQPATLASPTAVMPPLAAESDESNSGEILYITYAYDPQGRLTKVNSPNGSSTYTYTQGKQGELTLTLTDAKGRASRKTTDATGLTLQSKDPGGTVTYTYDARGNVLTTAVNGVVMTTVAYDTYGRQIKLIDANAGTMTYAYNHAGDILKQVDARGKTTTHTYDTYGRLIKRYTDEGETQYEFYNECNNQEIKHIWNSNHDQTFVYDNFGCLITKTEKVLGVSYKTTYNYNLQNHLASTTYANGIKIDQEYNSAGMLTRKLMNGKVLYSNTDINSLGQVTCYTLANGKASSITYDKGLPTRYFTEGIQDLYFEFDSQNQNLLSRRDALKHLKENFTYDALDRLTSATVNGTEQFKITYSNSGAGTGNIASKSNMGAYAYQTDKPNALLSIVPINTPPAGYPNIKSITYSSFQRPLRVEAESGAVLDLTYGIDDERIQTIQRVGNQAESRIFMGDYEIQTLPDGRVNHLIYVAGDAGLAAMLVNGVPHAVYTDYLGSILKLTNPEGAVVAEQNFDAWGRRRNVNTWTYENISQNRTQLWLYRGYTGHEHLDAFGLINMNARLYDPYSGRMLSPDNYVSDASSTQAYNRYSYANNNPLKYTDPTGNFIFSLLAVVTGQWWALPITIGADIGAWSGGSMANGTMNPFQWDWSSGKTWGYMAGGAIVGGISGAAGNAIVTSGIPFANTTAIIVGSTINSLGTHIYTGGQTDISISFGIGSYNFTTGEFGYLGKKGNSVMENIGYGLGAIGNAQDILAGFHPGNVNLETEYAPEPEKKIDPIGHTQLTDSQGNSLIDFGPEKPGTGRFIGFSNARNNWIEHASKGTVKRTINLPENTLKSPISIKGVNINRLNSISNRLAKDAGQYNFVLRSCSSVASRSLLLSGKFLLGGIHPYLFRLSALINNAGFRPSHLSYYLLNR